MSWMCIAYFPHFPDATTEMLEFALDGKFIEIRQSYKCTNMLIELMLQQSI